MNPVLVEIKRNGIVESCHRGSVLAVDANGKTQFALGDVARDIYPRSSLKFFQALPLLASGAAEAFDLSDAEIALACASHNGEAMHVACAQNWLVRLGLGDDDLVCGAGLPMGKKAARELLASGNAPLRVHHNCSGKHAGQLTFAQHLGAPSEGYADYTHQTQRAWLKTMGDIVGADMSALIWERDGCGLPAICMPFTQLAFAFSRFAVCDNARDNTARAMAKILQSVRDNPQMLAGDARCCSAVVEKTGGTVVAKVGAEGVYAGIIAPLQIGFAIKIDDGATRAAEVALGALLQRLGALDENQARTLDKWFRPQIKNSQGALTGEIAPSEIWAQS